MSTEQTPNGPQGAVLGRQDLASAFGPGARTSGLAGRLKRPTAPSTAAGEPEAQTEPAEPGTAAESTTAPAAPPAAAPRRRATSTTGERSKKSPPQAQAATEEPRKPAAPRSGSGNANYPVHVPADLVPAFNERRDREGTSNTLLVFDAIDALVDHDSGDPYGRLRQAVSADVIGDQPTSLFSRAPKRARPTSDGPRARSQIMLRMSEDNRAVIEQLVTETGALDRSHLITVALTQFLTPPTTR